jgi:osmotically-inducible protein OsmY
VIDTDIDLNTNAHHGRPLIIHRRESLVGLPDHLHGNQHMMGTQQQQQQQQQQVARAASEVLANSAIRELRQLRVDGNETELKLSGQVRSFYHKQLAQETVRRVAGGMQLVNRVHVCA